MEVMICIEDDTLTKKEKDAKMRELIEKITNE